MSGGAGDNLTVDGDDGAFAWTYGTFTGSVTSTAGSAVVSSIGNVSNATFHGRESASVVTVGSLRGDVTADEEYAGIISLLSTNGTQPAGKGALLFSDRTVNVSATCSADLVVWARRTFVVRATQTVIVMRPLYRMEPMTPVFPVTHARDDLLSATCIQIQRHRVSNLARLD